MTDPQKQWSKEPIWYGSIFESPDDLPCCYLKTNSEVLLRIHGNTKEELERHAQWIARMWSFCAGEDIEGLTLTQIRNESAELNASVEKLVADNSRLTQQAEANKEAREWLENWAPKLLRLLDNDDVTSSREQAQHLREILLSLSQPSPVEAQRKEKCCECGNMISDWVNPDWASGRICRPCESKYGPTTVDEQMSEAQEKK